MKDKQVEKDVKELRELVDRINVINAKLYNQGVTYMMKDTYNESTKAKEIVVDYLVQRVEYE